MSQTSCEATERKILRGVFEDDDAGYRTGDLLLRNVESASRIERGELRF